MINPPISEVTGPGRALECQEQLAVPVRRLIDDAVTEGWTTIEVFDALEEVIRNRRLAYTKDPESADAPSELSLVPDLAGATANL